jgi:hypothetical protein
VKSSQRRRRARHAVGLPTIKDARVLRLHEDDVLVIGLPPHEFNEKTAERVHGHVLKSLPRPARVLVMPTSMPLRVLRQLVPQVAAAQTAACAG